MNHLVTVCMITYNAEKWIAQAIESVLAQTYKDFELLIVNDGSTDATDQIIQSFMDARIRWIRLEQNKGFAAGMNRAYSEVKSEFIFDIGSDDYIAPDYLQKMVDCAKQYPDIDYYYPDHFELVDKSGNRIARWDYRDFSDNHTLEDFLGRNNYSPVPHPGSLKRKALFDRLGLYEEVETCEDFVYLCKNALEMRFKRVDNAGDFFYRRLKTGLSSSKPKARAAAHAKGASYLPKTTKGKTKLLLCSPWHNCWLRYLGKYFNEKYDVKICKYRRDASKFQVAIDWADIVFFNWSDGFLKYWSQREKRPGKKYIAFLRSYEIWDTNNPWKINWNNIDHLIFVNPLIRQCFLDNVNDRVKDFKTPTHFIPNAIDLEQWKFIKRNQNKKIAWVNDLSNKKGVQLLTQFAFYMPYNYSIFPAGGQGDLRRSFYFNHITCAMRTDSRIAPIKRYKDVQEFLSDKSYALCTSVVEGHPNALLEAMAVGIKPIIHNFPGSTKLFPEKYIYNTVGEAVDMLKGAYCPSEYRAFVEDNYDMKKVYPRIEELF